MYLEEIIHTSSISECDAQSTIQKFQETELLRLRIHFLRDLRDSI